MKRSYLTVNCLKRDKRVQKEPTWQLNDFANTYIIYCNLIKRIGSATEKRDHISQ